jgi:hypothetical protein
MDVNEAITRFKNGCVLPLNIFHRKVSIETQFQRNVWEVAEPLGLVRIMSDNSKLPTSKCKIIAYNRVSYKINKSDGKPFEFEIPKSTYDELFKLYKGDFKEDKAYLKRWYGTK